MQDSDRMSGTHRHLLLLLLLPSSTLSSNVSEPIDLLLPKFIEENFPKLSNVEEAFGQTDAALAFLSPISDNIKTATSREGAFVTPVIDTESPQEDIVSFEELFTESGDVIQEEEILTEEEGDLADMEGIAVSESRQSVVFRRASESDSEIDYEAGYDVDYGTDTLEERSSGYGVEDSGGYGGDSHGGSSYGGSSHGGSSYGQDSYSKVQPKKPGPYGYETPNFKCEKSSETLYVTETEWTFDKKCYNVFKVQCTDGYDTGKGIGYQKHCNEFTVSRCRTVFDTSSEERCWTVYKKQCEMIYETIVEWEYEQKCTTSYEEECHGYGYHQDCEKVPKEHCKQVPKKVEKQVPRTKCKQVPDQRCQDFPINVPRKECREFPKTVCTQDPVNTAKQIPKKTCVQIPREVCNKIPRQIIKEVPKKVGKKVCTSTKPSSYGHAPAYKAKGVSSYESSASSYEAPQEDYGSPASDSYGAPPSTGYSAPAATGYGAPPAQPSYSAPSSSYGHRRSLRRSSSGHKASHQGRGQQKVTPSDHWALGPG